jgi:hypothetical protein
VLDSHTDSEEMIGHNEEVSFTISSYSEFRFLRFIMTGMNSSGGRELILQRLEIFGLLKSTHR